MRCIRSPFALLLLWVVVPLMLPAEDGKKAVRKPVLRTGRIVAIDTEANTLTFKSGKKYQVDVSRAQLLRHETVHLTRLEKGTPMHAYAGRILWDRYENGGEIWKLEQVMALVAGTFEAPKHAKEGGGGKHRWWHGHFTFHDENRNHPYLDLMEMRIGKDRKLTYSRLTKLADLKKGMRVLIEGYSQGKGSIVADRLIVLTRGIPRTEYELILPPGGRTGDGSCDGKAAPWIGALAALGS